MGRSQQVGMGLMAVTGLNMLVMLIGVMRRSYLVIALPVLAGVGVVSALGFWVGWTLMSTDAELAELEEQDHVPAVA